MQAQAKMHIPPGSQYAVHLVIAVRSMQDPGKNAYTTGVSIWRHMDPKLINPNPNKIPASTAAAS